MTRDICTNRLRESQRARRILLLHSIRVRNLLRTNHHRAPPLHRHISHRPDSRSCTFGPGQRHYLGCMQCNGYSEEMESLKVHTLMAGTDRTEGQQSNGKRQHDDQKRMERDYSVKVGLLKELMLLTVTKRFVSQEPNRLVMVTMPN